MRTCTRCGVSCSEDDFNFKNKRLGKKDAACKDCTRKAVREHYTKNRHYYLTKVSKRNKSVRILNRKYLHEYLSTHPCVDCGEKDPVVLEFDHFENKRESVARLCRTSTLEVVKGEVEKCVVRCANCHRRKTAKEFNWTR